MTARAVTKVAVASIKKKKKEKEGKKNSREDVVLFGIIEVLQNYIERARAQAGARDFFMYLKMQKDIYYDRYYYGYQLY